MIMVLAPKDRYLTHYTPQIQGYTVLRGTMGSTAKVSKNQLSAPRTYYRHPHNTAYIRLSAPASFHVSPHLPLTWKILKKIPQVPFDVLH